MKLLLDEMYPAALAAELRRRGHDVVAVAERAELRSTDDEQLLLLATGVGRVLATENIADYPDIIHALQVEGQEISGVILLSPRTFPRTDHGFGRLVGALDAYMAGTADHHAVMGGIHWLVPDE